MVVEGEHRVYGLIVYTGFSDFCTKAPPLYQAFLTISRPNANANLEMDKDRLEYVLRSRVSN